MALVSKDKWKVTSTVKMCRSNFRVRVDLCKFYNDVRRFCWIFVDGTKMLRIAHAVDHITKLFNIKEPFHLLLNETEYLPPDEDIRVLKENETILVCPGTGLEGETELPTIAINTTVPEVRDSFAKTEIISNLVLHKESQTNFYSVQSEPSVVEKNELIDALNRSQNDALETSSMIYDRTEDEMNSTSDSKVDGQILSDLNVDSSLRLKRKRTRTRRKKKTQEVTKSVKTELVTRKPKIINTYVISTSKHIRFDNLDSPEIVEKEITPSNKMNGSCTIEEAPSELANLLSLGENSTPVTFTNSQVKQEIKLEHVSDEENKLENNSKSNNVLKQLQEGRELTSKDLEACPALIAKPELKDIVAFKMLKIGSDYTPQVSEFIVAKVISYCPKTLLYTFKVLYGLSEVQVPVGKFTLIEDEEIQTVNDTITINIAQLIEPRIVSTTDADKVPTTTEA
nr:coilin-like [Megalopta genalis]